MSDFLPSAARCRRRAQLINALRCFFDERGFVEVDTPVAIAAPAPEVYIDPPAVDFAAGMGRPAHRRFLQASPELAMKRLLAAGLPQIYQIAPTFRAGDHSSQHRNEFRMLEWYRAGASAASLQDDCEALLLAMLAANGQAAGAPWVTQGQSFTVEPPFARLSLQAAFAATAGFSLVDCVGSPQGPDAAPVGDLQALARALRGAQIAYSPTDSWDDLFHRAFLVCIEPLLEQATGPVFVTDFPAPLAALASLQDDDPRLSQRFELYVGGMELANGYTELTCPRAQRARFVEAAAARQLAGKLAAPLDEDFLAALPQIAAAAGIALGLDRLLMLLWDLSDIEGTRCLPERIPA